MNRLSLSMKLSARITVVVPWLVLRRQDERD